MTMDMGTTACSAQVTVGANRVGLRREDCQDGVLTGPEQTNQELDRRQVNDPETCREEEGEREERCRMEEIIPNRL